MNALIRLLTAGALAATTALAGPALAGSLWAKGSARTRAIVTDDTARNVGDVLTIIIAEQSKIENETNRNAEKKTSRDAKMSGKVSFNNVAGSVGEHIFDFPDVDYASSSGSKFDGKSNYDTDRSMSDQITVTVQDVQPNGNLVVLGTRTREVAGDTQVIQVSGIVRPSDINFANTVTSDRVADFHIVHKTSGMENSYTKPGWLTRIANALNPF